MPLHDYKCRYCGYVAADVYRKMSNDGPEPCPRCNVPMEKQIGLPHTDLKAFSTPIEMFSIALDTNEDIREFKRRCPDVEVSEDEDNPLYGIPIAANRRQKKDALAVSGFVEK